MSLAKFFVPVVLACVGVVSAAPLEILKVEQDASAHSKNAPAAAPAGGKKAGPAGPTATEVNQNRTIDTWVRNTTGESQTGTVRYWAIGRDMKSSKVSVFDGGEKAVTLKPGVTEMVASDEIKSDYKQRSSFVASGAAKKGAAPAPNAAANQPEGTKVVGFAVQVIKDGKVLDERYSEPTIKKLIGGTDNGTPAPLHSKGGGGEAAPAAN